MAELRKLAKNGHSVCVVVPRAYLRALGWTSRDVVILELEGKSIVVSKAVGVRQQNLLEPAPVKGPQNAR